MSEKFQSAIDYLIIIFLMFTGLIEHIDIVVSGINIIEYVPEFSFFLAGMKLTVNWFNYDILRELEILLNKYNIKDTDELISLYEIETDDRNE